MANTFQSITSGLAELKNYYQGPIINALNNEVRVYRACEKIKQGWSGYQVVRPIRVRRNQGIGATTDGGNLPSIGKQTTVQALIASKFLYLRFGVTGPMIKASQSDVGSFVRSAAYELEQGYGDLKSDINRQLSWNGVGNLATMSSAATASASITIAGRESTEPALKFVDVGLVFDIYTSAGAVVQTGITVNSITTGTGSSATAVMVCDQPVTASATDILVRSGSYNQEVQGLLTALDGLTTTIYSVDRSQYLSYQGNVTDLASAQLTLNAMQGVFNEGLRRGSVGNYSAIWTDFTSLQYYQKLLTPDKRYTNTTEGDGSFGSKGEFYLNFNGIPIVPDKDAPTRFFFLPKEVLKMYVLSEMEFADETGSMYIAQTDVDQFEVRIRHFVNLFNEQPAACAVLKSYISP
jgi:hypothetical protein